MICCCSSSKSGAACYAGDKKEGYAIYAAAVAAKIDYYMPLDDAAALALFSFSFTIIIILGQHLFTTLLIELPLLFHYFHLIYHYHYLPFD